MREVTGIITHSQIIQSKGYVLPPGHVEIREHKDGTYSVWYPEEGFIACPVNCTEQLNDKRHKCSKERPMSQSFFGTRGISAPEPDRSYEAALEYAKYLAGDREIQVIRHGKDAIVIS